MNLSYTFDKTDSGYIGKAFEMAVKEVLHRRNASTVSPAGRTDFCRGKYYDVKQNGTVLQYNPGEAMIKGSSRVIYATHVAHTVEAVTDSTITISIDLGATDMFVLDRKEFIDFLLSTPGFCKVNASRGTLNIQTMYNYKKNAYHGKKGRVLEAWMEENRLFDDSTVEDILDGFYSL